MAGIAAAVGPALIALGLFLKLIVFIGTAAVVTTASIFALVAAIVAIWKSPKIGKFFFEEFKIVQHVASQVVINLMRGWIFIKFGFKQAVAGMRVAWDAFVNLVTRGVATIIDQFEKLPFLGDKLAGVADKMRAAAKENVTGLKMFAKNHRELQKELEANSDLADIVFEKIEANFKEKEDAKVKAAKEASDKIKAIFDGLVTPAKGPNRPEMSDFNRTIQQWANDASNMSVNIATAFTEGLDELSAGIAAALFGAEVSFTQLAQSIAQEVTTQVIRSVIANAASSVLNIGGDMTVATMNANSAVVNQTAAILNQAASATALTAANINAAAAAAGVGAGSLHGGGMAGHGTPRTVPASTFIGAPRLHGGLADDEFASILERGEVVLSKSNVAEMKGAAASGGSGSSGSQQVNFNIQAIDAAGVQAFFKKHRRLVAGAIQTASRENNPIRRSR